MNSTHADSKQKLRLAMQSIVMPTSSQLPSGYETWSLSEILRWQAAQMETQS